MSDFDPLPLIPERTIRAKFIQGGTLPSMEFDMDDPTPEPIGEAGSNGSHFRWRLAQFGMAAEFASMPIRKVMYAVVSELAMRRDYFGRYGDERDALRRQIAARDAENARLREACEDTRLASSQLADYFGPYPPGGREAD